MCSRIPCFRSLPCLAFPLVPSLGEPVLLRSSSSYPGLGNLAVSAITSSDYNICIQGYVLWLALIYMVINLIVDASYIYVDPRMRLQRSRIMKKKNRFLQNKTFVVFSILALCIILAAIFAPVVTGGVDPLKGSLMDALLAAM